MCGNRKTTWGSLCRPVNNLVFKFGFTAHSFLAFLNDGIKGDNSGRQAKIMSNEAGGNFTRGFVSCEPCKL